RQVRRVPATPGGGGRPRAQAGRSTNTSRLLLRPRAWIVEGSCPAPDTSSTRHTGPGAEDSWRDTRSGRGVVRVCWPATSCVSVEFKTRLASRALRAQLSPSAYEVEQLDAYYELLVRWNQ